MDKGNALKVAQWGAVGLGLYALGSWLGVFRRDPDPLVPPDVDVPDLDAPTWTRQQARTVADAIYAALYGSGGFWTGSTTEDERAVVDLLKQVNTNGDAALLVDEYGVRGSSWSLTGDLNLPAALTAYLSPSDLAEVNADYREREIAWAW